jgi:DDE superfamily endonuclease
MPQIFSVIRRRVLSHLPAGAPLCVAIDDSLLRKTGMRIPGVAWRRDPLGPRFQTNFIRAQRFLQFSANVPLADGNHRLIPISFTHAPTPPKPSVKASGQQLAEYRKASRMARLPLVASQQITALRQALDDEPEGAARPLRLFVDNGYTNAIILKNLPANTVLVGRIRKDAKLYFVPSDPPPSPGRGRPRRYGRIAPTPEQLRVDDTIPWQTVPVCIAGVAHSMRVKVQSNLLWRTAGLEHTLQLVVIAPLGYRLRKGSKLLYRQPAFLICTDPELDLASLLQGYIQRWDIEVNFREEKTLLGVGDAQVRHPESVETVPALQVASYAMLLLATIAAGQRTSGDWLPRPKWSPPSKTPQRTSTQRAIGQIRAEVWARALGLRNFSDFVSTTPSTTNSEKFLPHLPSAVFYASN